MPGGWNEAGSGIRETDDESRAFLPGEAEGSGKVNRVQGGYGTRVAGGAHTDVAWEGIRWKTELGSHGLRWVSTYL